MSTQAYQSTTQVFLDIYDITNDLLLMKDGTASVIVTVDAMNFGLLAEEEQDAVMYAYAGLLNSLNYPIQIVIRSQTKDVTSYLQKLKEQEDLAETRLNQTRISRYREFVSNLIRERNVLDKKFYVVIPATSIELGILPTSDVIPGKEKFDMSSVEKSVILEKARSILEPKRDHIIGQFGRIGLYSRQLNTQEIIQLFYLSYNPEAADGQQLTDSRNYTTPMVSASIDQAAVENFNSAKQTPLQQVPVQQPVAPTVEQTIQQPTAPPVASVAEAVPLPQTSVVDQPLVTEPVLDSYQPPEIATQPIQEIQPQSEIPITTESSLKETPILSEPVLAESSPAVTQPPVQTQVSTPGAPVTAAQPKHFFIPPAKQAPVQSTVFTSANPTNVSPVTQPEQTIQSPQPVQAPPNVGTIEPVASQIPTSPQSNSNTIFASNRDVASQNITVPNNSQPGTNTPEMTITPPPQPAPMTTSTGPDTPLTVVASDPIAPADAQAAIDELANTVTPLSKPDEPLPPLPEIT